VANPNWSVGSNYKIMSLRNTQNIEKSLIFEFGPQKFLGHPCSRPHIFFGLIFFLTNIDRLHFGVNSHEIGVLSSGLVPTTHLSTHLMIFFGWVITSEHPEKPHYPFVKVMDFFGKYFNIF
jgi:hypothetical protein